MNEQNNEQNSVARRAFIRGGVIAAVASPLAAVGAGAAPDTDNTKILNYNPAMKYRQIGKTGIYLSVLSMGGITMAEPLHHYAIDHGVNLVHISQSYVGGESIKAVGRVMKTKRDKVYIAIKGNCKDLDYCLRTLNTDYVDFLMFPKHTARQAADPVNLELFERLKKEGKVRYPGLTCHGEVKEGTAAGIDSGMYDIVMPVLNQPNLEALDNELRRAYEKGIGVMAMKTMKGIEDRDLEVAYVKKALSNPAVTTILKGMKTFDMFDDYLKAANETLTAAQDSALYRHAQRNRMNNCMMCDECRKACPRGVEVSTVLRCKDYYFEQLGDVETAVSTFGQLPVEKIGDANCEDCRICERACPNGIGIVDRLHAARELFMHLA